MNPKFTFTSCLVASAIGASVFSGPFVTSLSAQSGNRPAPSHASDAPLTPATEASTNSTFPTAEIEKIIGAQGQVENGLLSFDISRDDLGKIPTDQGMKVDGSFELDGMIYFQKLGGSQAFLNGCFPVKASEANRFISALLSHGLVFQAFHQHFPSHPQIFFIHYRGKGDAVAIAKGVRAALNTTSVSLPQTSPKNPTSPLDANRLGSILHGNAMVGDDGVVSVDIDRTDTIIIEGVTVNPDANISTNVSFKPTTGTQADAIVDFSMTTEETVPVVTLMMSQLGWYQGCLYNQETGEHPQLYFDHMLKTGDAYQLAAEIRRGLDLTSAQ